MLQSNRIKIFLSENWLLVIPTVIYFIQFFLFFNKRVLYDENWVAVPVYNFFQTNGFWVTSVLNSGVPTTVYQFTFYQLLLLVFHLVIPKEIIFTRLINLLIVPAIFFSVYFLSKRIMKNRYWAVLPVLILSVDNVFFITSYIVRPDIFLGVGIPLILLLVYNEKFIFRTDKIFLAGLISFVLVGFHPNFLLAIISFVIAYSIYERPKLPLARNLQVGVRYFLIPVMGVILIAVLIFYTQGTSKFNLWNFITAYLGKTTTFNEAGTFFNPNELISEEGRRYAEFISFPFRLHIFILLIISVLFGLFQKEKILKIISLTTVLILLFFLLFLWNKNVRYMIVVLPSVSILTSFMFYKLYNGWNTVRGKLIISIIFITTISLLAGNIILIKSRWNTDYSEMKKALQMDIRPGEKILGDLVLWDIYRNGNFISYMSGMNSITSLNYDYVILGGKKTIQDENREYFTNKIFPRLNSQLIRTYDNFYYGNFRVYKIMN